jgi:hypothetical protein
MGPDRVGFRVGWAPPTNPKSLPGHKFGGGQCPPYGGCEPRLVGKLSDFVRDFYDRAYPEVRGAVFGR